MLWTNRGSNNQLFHGTADGGFVEVTDSVVATATGKKLVPLASVDSGARMVAEAVAAHDNV